MLQSCQSLACHVDQDTRTDGLFFEKMTYVVHKGANCLLKKVGNIVFPLYVSVSTLLDCLSSKHRTQSKKEEAT
jgi:hypothetical protein